MTNNPGEQVESIAGFDLEVLRERALKRALRVGFLGKWPSRKLTPENLKNSLPDRIPTQGQKDAKGFDAGLAVALEMMPKDKESLSAKLHGNYTREVVAQIREEVMSFDPDSETVWWLAGCAVCNYHDSAHPEVYYGEEAIDEEKFRTQLRAFEELRANPAKRVEAARRIFEKMMKGFSTEKYGVPFGTDDGCIQGAYCAGYPVGVWLNPSTGIYYVGTLQESLGLETFEWKKDDKGNPIAGPVGGSRQFVMCADTEEFKKALAEIKKVIPVLDTPQALPAPVTPQIVVAKASVEAKAAFTEKIPSAAKKRWAEIGRAWLDKIGLPEVLKLAVQRSLDTPQFGPHHHEGIRMDAHIGLMVSNIDSASGDIFGTFPYHSIGLDKKDTADLMKMVTASIWSMGRVNMMRYAYLHDIKKPDLMTAKHTEKSGLPDRVFTMEEWRKIEEAADADEVAIRAIFTAKDIEKISYRQDAELIHGPEDKDHGPEGDKFIRELAAKGDATMQDSIDQPKMDLILIGIANHEMHFQKFPKGRSAQLFEDALGRFNEDEQAFIFTACLIDIASSLSEDGTADYSGFRNMFEARSCARKVKEVNTQGWREDEVTSISNAKGMKDLQKTIDGVQKKLKARELSKIKKIPSEKVTQIMAALKAAKEGGDKKLANLDLAAVEIALSTDDYTAVLATAKLEVVIGIVRAELGK